MRKSLNLPVGTLMKWMTTTKGAILMSVDVIHKDIVEGKYKKEVEAIRKAYQEGTMVTVTEKGEETEKPLYDELKKDLPYFVPQADVRERRMWENAKDYTGFAPVDCDYLSAEEIEQLMEWAKQQPWVKEGHRSSRNEGVHLIVAMGIVEADNKKDYDNEYKRRYSIISKHIQQETGIKLDGQCKDILRGIFVSYDPQAFIRKDSEVKCFEYPDEEDIQTPATAAPAEPEVKEVPKAKPALVNGFYKYHTYNKGERHGFWLAFGQRLRYKKEDKSLLGDYRDLMKALLESQKVVLADDPLLRSGNEVDEAMDWGYEHSESEGEGDESKNKQAKTNSPADSTERQNIMDKIHEFLDNQALFRFNTLTEQVEIKEKGNAGKWKEMDDTLFLTYYDRVKRFGIKTNRPDVEAAVRSLDHAHPFDPVKEYLDSLDPWTTNDPDYITELFSYLEFENDEERKYAIILLKKWFICMVAQWLGFVDDNQTMPIIRGEQNAGKSFFIRHLLPPELRQYYKEIHPADKLDKDQRIAMSRFLLMNFEEFTLSEGYSSNQTKAYISAAASTERASYGHFHKNRKRKASLIASCNDEQFIVDKRGSRRYLAFTITGTKHIDDASMPYAGAYAQAYYLVTTMKPEDYRPSKQEADDITAHNSKYMIRSLPEIIIKNHYRKPANTERGEYITMGDIMEKLSLYRIKDISETQVGTILREMEIEKKRRKRGFVYKVKEITKQDVDEDNQTLDESDWDYVIEEARENNTEIQIPF